MKSSLTTQIEALAQLLKANDLRLATAESCTGGGIAEALTSVAGSSAWFECGFVSYSNESKQSNAQVSVSVSGVAGPGGGTSEKPVGFVWIAWTQEGSVPSATCFHFQGGREQVRYQAIEAGIAGITELLLADKKSSN